MMRYGGDEFVLMAAGYDEEAAENCVARIEAGMQKYNSTGLKPYPLEASIGYCITTLSAPEELNALIDDADHEMYKKKYVKKALKNKTIR